MTDEILELSKIKRTGEVLVLQWKDGRVTSVSLKELRDGCPCANCQGETILFKRYEAPKQLPSNSPGKYELASLSMVGNYALQPVWKDSHSTGLFSLAYLLSLSKAECQH